MGISLRKGIDMALASMADVAILTVGSFGDYAAILTKDKDTYFPKNHAARTELVVFAWCLAFQDTSVFLGICHKAIHVKLAVKSGVGVVPMGLSCNPAVRDGEKLPRIRFC